MRAFGAREMAAGIGILAQSREERPWVWSRVAGDALDLGALSVAARGTRRPAAVATAIASVAAVTALDLLCGLRLPDRRALAY